MKRTNRKQQLKTIVYKLFMNERAYNDCVNEHADHLYRFIVKNLKQEEDSKDIVQSSFEKLWINREKIEACSAKSYLFTVGYHLMIDHIRKNKRVQLQDDFSEDGRSQMQHNNNTKVVLMEALNRLNEIQRSLVMLKDYEGYSYEEIGAITDLSASQVKVYLHRARLTLKKYIGKPENVQ